MGRGHLSATSARQAQGHIGLVLAGHGQGHAHRHAQRAGRPMPAKDQGERREVREDEMLTLDANQGSVMAGML
jgi:hypothetical protein